MQPSPKSSFHKCPSGPTILDPRHYVRDVVGQDNCPISQLPSGESPRKVANLQPRCNGIANALRLLLRCQRKDTAPIRGWVGCELRTTLSEDLARLIVFTLRAK